MNNNFSFKKSTKSTLVIFSLITIILLSAAFSSSAVQLKNGSLSISSTPKGAAVYLDNNFKGNTPLDIKNIPTGQYNLKMILAGYEDWTSTVVILPILTVKISADLVPLSKKVEEYGSISVNSNPQGARVYLDNAYKGNTPMNIRDVAVGRHNIRIILSGYEEWITNITVTPSKVERVSANLEEQTSTGSISINSDPRGADIYINDNYEGITPLNLTNLSSGDYTIKITMPDYEEWVSEVTVSSKRETKLYAELVSRPSYGSMSIYCDQKDAKVFLNGTYRKTITQIPTLLEKIDTGNYEIVIIKDGFRAWIKDVEIFSDETTSVDAGMIEIFR